MHRRFSSSSAVLAAAVVLAGTVAFAAAPADAASALRVEAETMSLDAGQGTVFADPSASGGQGLLIWSDGTASTTVTTTGARAIAVRARGDQCDGAPRMVVAIDGKTVLDRAVDATSWTTYAASLAVPDGTHTLTISFTNDFVGDGCDRNLRLDDVAFSPGPGFEAEAMSLPAAEGTVFSDTEASGGKGLLIWSNGTASMPFTSAGVRSVSVRARGDQCDGAPRMVVAIDGKTVLDRAVDATSWTTYSADVALANGPHTVTVSFANDFVGDGCDRNLRIDRVTLSPVADAPFAAARWYLDPYSNAQQQVDAWSASDPTDAAEMEKIASEPEADWFGDWSGDIQTAVADRVETITAAGALPVLVAYDIPERDCGSYSSGGATSPAAYRSWIRGFAAGIGAHRAIVVLEPDALAGLDCLSPADQQTRLALLRDAVAVLAAHPRVSVYIDAGHPGWHTPAEIASRLLQAGIQEAQGFALNVSAFDTTAANRSYGDAISALTGGAHFLVDTSRNGLGPAPDGSWCNPPGRALGDRPTAATGDSLADAYLWIKRPGESDGTCNGGPPAGTWWPDYALGLAERAAY